MLEAPPCDRLRSVMGAIRTDQITCLLVTLFLLRIHT